jgi:dTDP-4-dehydrorhamnose 3,5-epimerase
VIPEGFAHGFVVLLDTAEFLYKTTDYWASIRTQHHCLGRPTIGIQPTIHGYPALSAKDQQAKLLAEAEHST